ncbi:unnamed protein product [Bursaphelenchus okinawaensis]|uniref:Uncharacterized protein n=1 Tax=Bursaphelenchus okinawaensis TaxID=465554 RepID=A0A811LMX0_9BILA|nr:unnamed protein product [Bursaphelenchus okinawaensis]CAG9125498.1 unnamed protein product [Bursaphelenchus okinawaensis]
MKVSKLPYSFKLQDAGETDVTKAELPDWLNSQIAEANASSTKSLLGNVDVGMVTGELKSNGNGYNREFVGQGMFSMTAPTTAPKNGNEDNFKDDYDVDYFFPPTNNLDQTVDANNKSYAQSIGMRLHLVLRNASSEQERKMIKGEFNSLLYRFESSC